MIALGSDSALFVINLLFLVWRQPDRKMIFLLPGSLGVNFDLQIDDAISNGGKFEEAISENWNSN